MGRVEGVAPSGRKRGAGRGSETLSLGPAVPERISPHLCLWEFTQGGTVSLPFLGFFTPSSQLCQVSAATSPLGALGQVERGDLLGVHTALN